jgi:hypothetical protein
VLKLTTNFLLFWLPSQESRLHRINYMAGGHLSSTFYSSPWKYVKKALSLILLMSRQGPHREHISQQFFYFVEIEVTLRLTVSKSVCIGVEHPFGAHDQISLFPFFCRKIALLFVLGLPLWREDGSVICSSICQRSESRRTHKHILLSHLRHVGSLSVASYDSQGLRWKYSYPPPLGDFYFMRWCLAPVALWSNRAFYALWLTSNVNLYFGIIYCHMLFAWLA